MHVHCPFCDVVLVSTANKCPDRFETFSVGGIIHGRKGAMLHLVGVEGKMQRFIQ